MNDIVQMALLPYSEQWTRHRWALELEYGRARLICLDPCDTFECTPDCATRTDPKVIQNLGSFRVIEHQEVCTCGQYAKFREAFDAAAGRMCACMLVGEETDLVTGQLGVTIEFVDDSTPAGPWGGPEYSHYLVAHSIPPQHAPNPAFGGRTRDEQAWRGRSGRYALGHVPNDGRADHHAPGREGGRMIGWIEWIGWGAAALFLVLLILVLWWLSKIELFR